MTVKIGEVETFQDAKPDKAQVMKILEESAEVFGAWQLHAGTVITEGEHSVMSRVTKHRVLDECADVIQATCNLIAALEVEDFTFYIEECRKRNEERGRL